MTKDQAMILVGIVLMFLSPFFGSLSLRLFFLGALSGAVGIIGLYVRGGRLV